MTKNLFYTALSLIGIMGALSLGVVNAQEVNKDIVLEATSTAANQTLKINKYFNNAYTVDRGDGSLTQDLTGDTVHTYSVASGYTITLSTTADRWTFQNVAKPLVPTNGTTVTDVKIAYMPSLADGFGNSETNPGNSFFGSFNQNGAITSLPSGSFDTSKITTVGNSFFPNFNNNGQLTSLPSGSFDTSKITTVGSYFFSYFNSNGQLTSLPEGSFDTSNITTVGERFFFMFNNNGQLLTSLPKGSFDISKITSVGGGFFYGFNMSGAITSLPEKSFRLSTGLTTVGDAFFSSFNNNGQLISLPTGSFDTSNITATVGSCFREFNNNGQLTSLPTGSFDTSKITTVGYGFFLSFNNNGQLTSLPEGSFDTSKISTVGNAFFSNFNYSGQLISLPEKSFRLSTGLTTVGDSFFSYFNSKGQLTSLPEGSFDTSKISTAGDYFFNSFNYNGKITVLPDSFKLTSAAYNKSNSYNNVFNSSNYTLNKRVSDLVSGVTVPSTDRNTFSDNQPGRCGVHANRLASTANACSITYDSNGGSTITNPTKRYTANTPSVVAGNGISVPTREGYFVEGWYDVSGNKVNEVIFPDMDGRVLYAHWERCSDGYVVNSNGTSCVLKEYTITYNLGGGYMEDGEGNKYEGNQVVTYTYSSTGNKYVSNLERESVSRENSKFLGWYTSEGEAFDFGTIPPEKDEAFAKYECDFGYAENDEKTACEKIRVDFDANGGVFSDNDNIFSIIKSKQVLGEKTGVLHTANLDDNDNYTNEFNGQTINGYTTYLSTYTSGGITTYPISSPSIVYFEEENVEKLNVSIKYGGSPYCTPGYIIVWTGDHRQFDANYNPSNTGLAVLYIADFPNFGENREESLEIEGDSFTIYQNNGCPSYGFFTNVSRTGIVDLIYEDNAFENIPEPTREGHSFKGWYLSDGTEFDSGNVSTGEVTYVYAKWECADGYENKGGECVKKSSGSSGGGGRSKTSNDSQISPDPSLSRGEEDSSLIKEEDREAVEDLDSNTPMDSSDKSSEGQEILSPSDSSFTKEQKDAYEFAKEKGITTMPTIQEAQMDGKLTRIAMAKMLSQYAMNVLGQKPANIVTPKFNDVTDKQNSDYDDGVTLAYQLGIMGQNMPNNKFRPDDEVTRAEFATALSRMIYNTSDGEYKATPKYYIHHMDKLVKKGIITNDNPNMKELRGYVMIMLMRSAGK